MPKGYLTIVLHSHLPFIRHPEYPDFLEEDWLFEAITETYIPLIVKLQRLIDEGVDFRIVISLSPTLCEMLKDPLLDARYVAHIDKLRDLAKKEMVAKGGVQQETAAMYYNLFNQAYEVFERLCHRNLLKAFEWVAESGKVELATTSATHAILPFISKREALAAQIKVAVSNFTINFGRRPKSFWLPECAYSSEIEDALLANGIRHIFVDSHAVLNGSKLPKYSVYAPVKTPKGIIVFPRDIESSKQVWSAKEGYPGDGNYREFYRDIGYDAPYEYIKPYLHSDGVRRNIGIKYHKITGDCALGSKDFYNPAAALNMAAAHAGNFMFNRQQQLSHLAGIYKNKPIIVAPYDTELFGHWWFEGPSFLDFLFRKVAFDQDEIKFTTPGMYLETNPKLQTLEPSISTWGDKGYFDVWLNGVNDWIYRHQHKAEELMIELAKRFVNADGILRRALNQCARELLLAQASDWAFLLSVGYASPYARKRFSDHIDRFTKLRAQINSNAVNQKLLSDIENKDSIFQEIDYRVFSQ